MSQYRRPELVLSVLRFVIASWYFPVLECLECQFDKHFGLLPESFVPLEPQVRQFSLMVPKIGLLGYSYPIYCRNPSKVVFSVQLPCKLQLGLWDSLAWDRLCAWQ